MKPIDYKRFRETIEAAHGRQAASPFSTLLSGQTDLEALNNYLILWHIQSAESKHWLQQISDWLQNAIDAEEIENQQRIPETYLQGLRDLGCLRAKIPQRYGGMGVSQCIFSRMLELISSHTEILALVSSVQQLGVAQGLLSLQQIERKNKKKQGEKLRKHYLSMLAQHAIGAFCLTTAETGSDPSCLKTIARVSADGNSYKLSGGWLDGGKLYTTLGTIADLFIMLAVVLFPGEQLQEIEPRKRITAFIVERNFLGIEVKALDFCGWHGLPNAAIKLDQVHIPIANQVGEIGDGLKIAFMNLGSGRINVSALSLGMMKQLQRISRWWGLKREQGGNAIGRHELNSRVLVSMNATIYASESFFRFVSALADQDDADVRLEAAMLKLYSSEALVTIADETLQLRGGRGYESYASQRRRGDTAVAVERIYRSARMMRIGEGGSNILMLYIMRCLVDDLLQHYRFFRQPHLNIAKKLLYAFLNSKHYIGAYVQPVVNLPKATPASLQQQLRRISKEKRRLQLLLLKEICREYGHYYRQKTIAYFCAKKPLLPNPQQCLEQRQILLAHCAWIATHIAIMSTTCIHASNDDQPHAIPLAVEFCKQSQEKIALHYLRLRYHSRERERELNVHNENILNGAYAQCTEQNILKLDLPDIRF